MLAEMHFLIVMYQAFSGMKSGETQRQKKEARLQGIFENVFDGLNGLSNFPRNILSDLIQLFGIRQQEGSRVVSNRTQAGGIQETLDNHFVGHGVPRV